MTHLPHIAARLFNTPLLIHPSKLQAIVAGLSSRLGVAPPNPLPDAYTVRAGTAAKGGYRVVDGIAVIDVFGALAHRAEMQADSSYVLGYETIGRMLDNALADRDVSAIVLNIDSPGGEVSGAFQLAEQIRDARAVKPIHAVASDLAASAGYLIASSAQSVSVTPTGQVGSIGVVTCHVDMSAALEKAGYKVTPIFAGSHKVDGNPYQPLPPAVADQIQAEIDHYYSMFVAAVAAGRPGLPVRAIRATEAALYIGAQAVEVGLADRVETPDQLIARLATEANALSSPSAARAANHLEPKKMADETEKPDVPAQSQFLAAAAIAESCIAAGEPALGRALLGKQLTAEQLQSRLVDAKEIRAMAKLAHMPEEATKMIVEGIGPDQAGQLLIIETARRDAALPVSNAHTGGVVVDGRDRLRDGLSMALQIRAGLEKDDKKNEFRGLTLIEVARTCLVQAGVVGLPSSRMGLASMAITHSASDFPVLLENVLNKTLLNSYTAAADTWRKWCATGSVSDFRPYKRIRMGSFGNLDALGEAGEYKSKKISDATAESVSIGTKANTVTMTRQAIINDDLGGFTRLGSMMGRAAARSIEADAYSLLVSNPTLDSDSTALFHANHANLASGGSAAAITMTSLDAARTMIKVQKDRSGNEYIGITEPFILLCPVAKAGAARTANESEYDPDTANKLQRTNITRGIFSAIVDTPYLSGTAWYLLANPNDFPTFEVLFLNGEEVPYTEQVTHTNVDGVQWLIRLDYGVNVVDYVGAFRNDGA